MSFDKTIDDQLRELIAQRDALLDALKAVKRLFDTPSPFYIKKLGSPITNGDQALINEVFNGIGAAIAKAEADK